MRKGGGGGSGSWRADAVSRPHARRAALVVLLALAAASCADGDDASGSPTIGQPGEAAAPAAAVEAPSADPETPSVDPEATEDERLAEPVALSDEAPFGNGIAARLAAIEAVEVVGHLPGEISGPGVAITVELTNDSTEPIDVNHVTVDLMDAEQASASPILAPEPEGLSGTLAPGASASGRYQFTLPPEERADATVRVSYAVSAPTVLFIGDLPQ